MSLPKVAFIGTGGTISSLGRDSRDIMDYAAHGRMMHAEEMVSRIPELAEVAQVIPIRFRNIPSYDMYFPEWQEVVRLCDQAAAEHPDLAGIVVGHGTASLEETAYMLNLTVKVQVPVVVAGSQRPASSISSDAQINLLNAVRTAIAPESRGRGVLVVLNDEIQAAREVTKTSTYRMHTFRTPDFGALGQADADRVVYYRRSERRGAPDTEFDIRPLAALPRVDITYAYTGADGTAVRAFIAAGARGIVSAGFAPGFPGTADGLALEQAIAAGVVVVQCTRAGSGRVYRTEKMQANGTLIADNLNAQKARLLLALALSVTSDPAEIARIFATY